MHDFLSMLPSLGIGMILLMAGILITRGPKQSLQSALTESAIWGTGFFLCFSTEILLLANL